MRIALSQQLVFLLKWEAFELVRREGENGAAKQTGRSEQAQARTGAEMAEVYRQLRSMGRP